VNEYPKQRARAAKWMYDRRDRVGWWRWWVLTERNSQDPECLKIEPNTAFLIFADMVQAGLMVPTTGNDGGDAFTINPGKEDEWKRVMNPRWQSVRQGGMKLVDYLVGGVIGAILGVVGTIVAQKFLGVG
jgi:hypothetical protein